MGTGRPPNELEGVVELQAVPLSDDAFGLLDRHPRLERVLELRTAFVARSRDRKEPTERGGCFCGGAGAHGLELTSLPPFGHGSDSRHTLRGGLESRP